MTAPYSKAQLRLARVLFSIERHGGAIEPDHLSPPPIYLDLAANLNNLENLEWLYDALNAVEAENFPPIDDGGPYNGIPIGADLFPGQVRFPSAADACGPGPDDTPYWRTRGLDGIMRPTPFASDAFVGAEGGYVQDRDPGDERDYEDHAEIVLDSLLSDRGIGRPIFTYAEPVEFGARTLTAFTILWHDAEPDEASDDPIVRTLARADELQAERAEERIVPRYHDNRIAGGCVSPNACSRQAICAPCQAAAQGAKDAAFKTAWERRIIADGPSRAEIAARTPTELRGSLPEGHPARLSHEDIQERVTLAIIQSIYFGQVHEDGAGSLSHWGMH